MFNKLLLFSTESPLPSSNVLAFMSTKSELKPWAGTRGEPRKNAAH